MSDENGTNEARRPTAGNTYWDDDDNEAEIAEVIEDQSDGRFKIVDEDGEEAIIVWNTEDERWVVDA